MTTNENVRELVRALAAVSETFNEMHRTLTSDPHVTSVTKALDFGGTGDNLVAEAYVDAELASGNGIVWWLDATGRDNRWELDAQVRVQTQQGQDLLRDLPTDDVDDDGLPAALSAAARRLAETIEEIDLATL